MACLSSSSSRKTSWVFFISSLLNLLHSGGLELLFSNQRKHNLTVPLLTADEEPATLGYLVKYLCDNVMKDRRKEMFILDGTVSVCISLLP